MDLTSASFAYPDLDRAARAAVAEALAGVTAPPDVFLLATCLRYEVAVPGDETLLKERLDDLIGALPTEPQVRRGADAVEHLFRLAAGLESPIIGEVEVLTQFRQALADLKDSGATDGGFLKLLEGAVATGRELRTTLDTSPHDTMAAIAAQVVGTVDEVAVVGSGTMATAVGEALAGLPAPPRIRVLARSPHLVSPPVESAEVVDMGALADTLRSVPAVISATAAASRLLDGPQMSAALDGRRDTLVLVDMAMPPDFAPGPDDPVRYVSIDDLAAMAWRRNRVTGLDSLVSDASDDAHHRYAEGSEIGPLIARMMRGADEVVDEMVDRFGGRLGDPRDADVLRQAVHTAVRTVLARPVASLNATRDPDVAEAIAWVFGDD